MADISKITILNGNTYDIKDATARSSIPSAATATPLADGTAAVGSSAKYAREDHRHPTDTSRAAASHTHSSNDITAGYLNIHPENDPTIIPFIHNDIAFLLKRGGSATVKYDNTAQSVDISNVFDGSGSYWIINPTGVTQIVIELTLHKAFGWTNTIYVDFGAAGWRSKSVKIELMNSSYSGDTWSSKYSTTTNSLGHVYVTTSHEPTGAANAGAGFNKIRLTFSAWNTATIFRISQIGVYNYGSSGVRETYMSRGIDDYVFRNITPNTTNTYSLGDSSHKWKDVQTTTLNGTTIPASPKFTDTTYTANTTKLVTTTVPNVTSVGSAPTLGTAIAADDITDWDAGSTPTLGTAIAADDITAWSAGTVPTLGTAIAADDITGWTTNTPTAASVSKGVLTITAGSAATLNYTARSIPNVTSVGTAPSLSYTARSIPNVTSVGSVPSLSYTARSIPNVTSVGSAPTLGTAITVATGSTASNGGGSTVATGITAG